MEDDRSGANIGIAIDTEYEAEMEEKPRQPRKRFVGRRAAVENAEKKEKKGDSSGAIEESGAVQGLYRT